MANELRLNLIGISSWLVVANYELCCANSEVVADDDDDAELLIQFNRLLELLLGNWRRLPL